MLTLAEIAETLATDPIAFELAENAFAVAPTIGADGQHNSWEIQCAEGAGLLRDGWTPDEVIVCLTGGWCCVKADDDMRGHGFEAPDEEPARVSMLVDGEIVIGAMRLDPTPVDYTHIGQHYDDSEDYS